jgi:predicted RNase H-like nuclease (RuvC/YqgF family)
MKYIIAIAILLFIGCTNSETTKIETNETTELDSILTKSQQNLTIVGGANQKSDSLVTGKVEHTVQKISHLETQVQQLKEENNELKDKLDDATDDGKPYSGLPISGN